MEKRDHKSHSFLPILEWRSNHLPEPEQTIQFLLAVAAFSVSQLVGQLFLVSIDIDNGSSYSS
jgi:hypothetical protein